MANLSRNEVCDFLTITLSKYKNWELGRYGGLPAYAALNIIKMLEKQGVVCEKNWLLTGEGLNPYVPPKYTEKNGIPLSLDSKHSVLEEIQILSRYYDNVVYLKIEDDAMSPQYEIGDIVAGIKITGEKIISLIEENCILLPEDSSSLVRNIRLGSKKGLYNLQCINLNTKIKKPIEYDCALIFAAKIIRVYKKA